MTCPVPRPRLYREHAELVNRMFFGEPLTEGERRRLRRVRRAIGRYQSIQWVRWENGMRKRPHVNGWHDWATREARQPPCHGEF